MTFSSILTYKALLESYLDSHVIRSKSESNYKFSIQRLEDGLTSYYQNQPVAFDSNAYNLTQQVVFEWRKYELANGLSPSSWNTYVRHLKAIFNHGIERGLLTKNPFNKTTITAPSKRKKVLTPYQISQTRLFLAQARRDDEKGKKVGKLHPVWFWQTVFETFYYTGMRRNQLIHLRVGDILLKKNLINIRIEGSKTWREYEIPISNHLLPYLQGIMKKASSLGFKAEDQLFNVNRFSERKSSRMSQEMRADRISNVFEDISKRLGMQISPHRFRHTLGTDLMKDPDRNLHLVKNLLGHTDIRTTLEYVQPDLGSIKNLLDNRA